jgi:hypothetical protein
MNSKILYSIGIIGGMCIIVGVIGNNCASVLAGIFFILYGLIACRL